MMTAKVTAVHASGVTVALLGRSGAGIEVPITAANIFRGHGVGAVTTGPGAGGAVVVDAPALALGDVVAVAELTAEPGTWLLLARLG